MKKIKFLFITLTFFLIFNNVSPLINAIEGEEETQEQILSEEEINIQKQEILASINGYLEEMSAQLESIDAKIENTKKQEEFEYYPAVRLNIDTPLFGMTSLVENKLRIKKDVSTSDVANKYSIRDVIEDRIIKLPENYLASIVMSTKEVKIDENMSLSELKLTLVKCIQYESQVSSAEEFIDTQINKTFKDYIAQEKKNNIKDVKDRTEKVKANLEEIADKICQMQFLGVDTKEYVSQYNQISEELYEISKKIRDTLMSSAQLTELMKKSVNNESSILDMKTTVDEAYEKAVVEMDYLKLLEAFSKEYETQIDKLDKYIDGATTEKKEVEAGEEKITTITNYEVTSQSTLDYMGELKTIIDNEIELYKNENSQETDTSNNDEQVEENEDSEQIEVDTEQVYKENKEKIDNIYSKYKDMLNREYKFYTNNINMLLRDSNTKMTAIIGQINSGIIIENEIFGYTRYIYINLPDNLSNYLEKNNLDSVIELNSLINSLNTELETLVKTNMNIKDMYEKMTEDLLKS